jgi:hypothetical protein
MEDLPRSSTLRGTRRSHEHGRWPILSVSRKGWVSQLEGEHGRVRKTYIEVLCVFLITVFVSEATGQAPPKPLSKDRIVQLLKGDVSPARVAELAHQRGIDFEITPDAEKELRNAGATDALITTLRGLAPKRDTAREEPALPVLVIESTPGGAQVFVDDEFISRTSSEGRLKIRLKPGQHRVRLSLEGYSDHEQSAQLVDGSSTELTVRLTQLSKLRGISVQDLAADVRQGYKGWWAVAITSVLPGSTADVAGFRPGDIIQSLVIGGDTKPSPTGTPAEFRQAVKRCTQSCLVQLHREGDTGTGFMIVGLRTCRPEKSGDSGRLRR